MHRDVGVRARRVSVAARSFPEHAPVAWVVLSLNGVVRRANEAAATLLGRRRQGLVGRDLALAVGADPAAVRSLVARCRRSRGSVRAELVVPPGSPDGHELHLDVVACRSGETSRSDVTIHAFLHDVTPHRAAIAEMRAAIDVERRQVAELAASERVLDGLTRAIAEPGPAAMRHVLELVAEHARAVADAERSALGILEPGREQFEQWVSCGASDETGAEDESPRPHGALALVAREGRAIRVDQTGEPGSFLGVPLVESGRSLGCLCVTRKRGGGAFTAIDERALERIAARAARLLAVLEARREETLERAWLDAVIDELPEAVFLADERGAVRRNRAALHLSARRDGAGADERGGLGGFVCEPEANPIVRALARGERTAWESFEMHRGGDERVSVIASAAPVRAAASSRTGAVAIVRDATEHAKTERLRESWASVVAHEVRQPLGAILLALGPLASSGQVEAAQAARRIRTSVQRINRMVDDLMDDAAIRTGTLAVKLELLDLRAVVAKSISDATHLTNGYAVELFAPNALPSVHADAGRLEQVVSNLLSNAAKYGEVGAPIHVRVDVRGDEVVTSVTNRGTPLAAPDKRRVFERGFRSASARHRGKPGLGLGLFITSTLLHAHGGRVGIETGPGTNTFWFALPATSPPS